MIVDKEHILLSVPICFQVFDHNNFNKKQQKANKQNTKRVYITNSIKTELFTHLLSPQIPR